MIRTIFLASAMTIAAPAVAQTVAPAPQTTQAMPSTDTMSSATVAGQATAGQVAPAQAAPTTVQTQAVPANPADAGAPQSAEAAPASGDQVASAVDTQFGTYDKNASLDKAEVTGFLAQGQS